MSMAEDRLREAEMVESARRGDDFAVSELVARYLPMIRQKASRYSLPGQEAEDIVQEGLIGFLRAIRLYDGRQSGFATFASLCVSSAMITAAKAALSQKSRPLNDYSSLEDSPGAAQPFSFSCFGPEDQIMVAEQMQEWREKIRTQLSAFEQQAFTLYLSGHSYTEIAKTLCTTTKAVDNALQRVRRKLRPA